MNETHDPQQPDPGATPPSSGQPPQQPSQPESPGQGYPAPPQPAARDSARFFRWLRSLGVQRGSSRWVGGVCSGLADRWGIDPVIVRGLTVVLTLFFGIGLLAYGLAWALLPEPDGRIHVEQVARGHWSTGMTGAAVATFLGLAGPGQTFVWDGHNGWFPWPVIWVAAIVCCVVWAVNRGKGQPPRPSGNPPWQQHSSAAATGTPYGSGYAAQGPGYAAGTETGPDPRQLAAAGPAAKAGAWTEHTLGPNGPLGANGPLGPNGPLGRNGRPALKAPPRLGAAASLLSLGLAVMVGALVLILNAAGIINLNGYQVAAAAAAAAITAGLAIIISGMLGRTAGGVGTFAIIALVVAGLLSVVPQHGPWTPLANQSWTPTSVSAAEQGLDVTVGNAAIDLTHVSQGSSLTADVQIPLNVVAAKVVVKVPTDIPVTVTSDLAVSKLDVQGGAGQGGGAVVQNSSTQLNPGLKGSGLAITLNGAAATITFVPTPGN